MHRNSLLSLINNSQVFDKDGILLGAVKECLPSKIIKIYHSQCIFNNNEYRNIFWVECPICGLRGKSIKEHGCNTGDLVAPGKYEGICPKCGKAFVIDRESRFRGQNCLCGVCQMKESQEKHNLETFGVKHIFSLNSIQEKCKETRKENLIKTFGVDHVMKVPEYAKRNKESRRQKSIERYGVPTNLLLPETKEKAKSGRLNFLKEHNVSSIRQLEGVNEKIKATNLERYGAENPFSSPEILEKIKATNLERYGAENPFETPEIREKIKATNLERYGAGNPFSSPEIREKIKATNLERYGVETSLESPEIREKIKATCMKLYGVDNVWKAEEIRERCRKSLKLSYGVEYPLYSEEIRNKIYHTNIEKYGVKFPFQNKEILKKTKSSAKNSKPEKKLQEMLLNRGISFIKHFQLKNHEFDFAICEKDSLQILLLIDIDGIWYHGHIQEFSDIIYEYDAERVTYCDKIPFIAISEDNLENGFKAILNVLGQDYEQYLADLFVWCRTFDPFPFPHYSDEKLLRSWKNVLKYNGNVKSKNVGTFLVKHFHPSLFYAHRGTSLSPVEGFNNDEVLMKCIKNRFIYRCDIDPSAIANGLTISRLAPQISLFSPGLAKYLVKKYLNQYQTIFDPFSGYSGRMLGTISADKQYIGQDINETTINESQTLAKFLNINPDLQAKDILDSSGTYECLFTCPPYSKKEIYGAETIFKSCDEWIDECLSRFKCKSYLFVVDKTEKYRNFVIETITNKSHLNTNTELVILISNANYPTNS